MSTDIETRAFEAEIRQLLNILAHSLYTEREIFLRELISNASDALNRIQFEMLTDRDVLDPNAELAIRLSVDEDAGTLTVSDTGIGMTRDELVENLGVIAHSGVQGFLKRVKESGGGPGAGDIIGQFGVGFYSAFMVADEVTVVSRSYKPDAPAHRWTSSGGDTFTIAPAEKNTRGTEVTLKLKDDAKEFLQEWKLREVVRKHSDYVAYPVYIKRETTGEDDTVTVEDDRLNQQTALWRQPANELTDEDYDNFYRQLTLDFEPPLLRIHMSADAPLQFYAVLFVPAAAERNIFSARREPGLKLYARKVLIQEYCTDLLPEYLNFVHGVVDSEDLPLNVSRESFQANRQIARLKNTLTHKILSELKQLATDDPEKYAKVWAAFGRHLKQGVATAPEDKDRIVPLLRFHSSKSEGKQPDVSLATYAGRLAKGQDEIYYVLGDDPASVSHSPHLDPFRQRGIEVLYFTDPLDSFMATSLQSYEGYKLRNIDDAGLDIGDMGEPGEETQAETREALPEKAFDKLKRRFVDVLGERVLEVRESRVLTGSAARLVAPENAPDRNMQRVFRFLEREYEIPKRIMEINRRHPLIHNLAAQITSAPDAPVINQVIEQLYESALLVDGLHPDPASMVTRIQALMEAATATALQTGAGEAGE
ncbi:MAG: molecular chaperone HtpG [Anaerolineae bacterium]|nr:molecular chaperone HtpG [Anaerolineae bacterium]